MLVNDLMADIIQEAADKNIEDNEDLIASVKDQEDDQDLVASAHDQEDDMDVIESLEEIKIELDLRDIHATMSQHEKEDQSRTKMIPNEKWTKTFDCSDMEEQLELLSKQDGGVSNNDNPIDEESIVENVTREEVTRSCNECNKKFKWMAELIKHMLSEHKPIDAGETDPMWYMLGELLAEVRDEQVLMREENKDFSRGMLQAMKLLTQTLTQDSAKNIQRMLASQLSTGKSQVFVCDTCSYESESKTALKMNVHCSDCNLLLSSMEVLSKHKQTVHKDKPEEEEDLKKNVLKMETLQIEVDNMKSMFKEQSQELQIKNAMIIQRCGETECTNKDSCGIRTK